MSDSESSRVFAELQTLIRAQDRHAGELELKMGLFQELAFDSISLMQLFLRIETHFDIQLRGDDIGRRKLRTLQDLVELVLRRQEETRSQK